MLLFSRGLGWVPGRPDTWHRRSRCGTRTTADELSYFVVDGFPLPPPNGTVVSTAEYFFSTRSVLKAPTRRFSFCRLSNATQSSRRRICPPTSGAC